jgi:CIC family chloride channel protein
MGAMMGAAVGGVAHTLFPNSTATPGAYALVGMGTAFAGVVRTPLTSVIMIFEITRDYTIIVPLMISNLIAFFISQKLQPEPIYEALEHQDGIHLPSAQSRSDGERTHVYQAMRPVPVVLSPDATVALALPKVTAGPFDAWPVVNEDGLVGMIKNSQIISAAGDGGVEKHLSELLALNDKLHHNSAEELPHVHPDHSLSLALERMGASGLNVLPVVSRANVRQLVGVVALNDILATFGVAPKSGNVTAAL